MEDVTAFVNEFVKESSKTMRARDLLVKMGQHKLAETSSKKFLLLFILRIVIYKREWKQILRYSHCQSRWHGVSSMTLFYSTTLKNVILKWTLHNVNIWGFEIVLQN